MNNSLCIEKFHELEFQAFVKQFQEENSNPTEVIKDQKGLQYCVNPLDQLDDLIVNLKIKSDFS